MRFYIVVLFLLLSSITVFSQKIWDGGGGNTNWGTGANWDPDGVPGAGDDVIIIDGVTVTINVNAVCNNLTIGQGVSGGLQTDGTNRIVTVNGKLVVNQGASFNARMAFPLTVTDSTKIYGTFTDNANQGSNIFNGIVIVYAGGTFNTIANSPHTFGGGIINEGSFTKAGTGAITFSVSQSLAGTNPINFTGGNITIPSGVTVTNSNVSSVSIYGILNGTDGTSVWYNAENTTLEYRNATAPMLTGVLDVDQSGNTVIYNASADQTMANVTYYHLTVTIPAAANRVRWFSGTTQNINGNLTITGGSANWAYVRFRNDGVAQSVNVGGDVLLTNAYADLGASNAGTSAHTLTVAGVINNNGTLNMWRATNQFVDIVLTGAGNVITGNGVYTLRNLTLNNAAAKTSNSTSTFNFYSGNGPDAFTNNNGSFTALAGTFRFPAADTFAIAGTGAITLNNLTAGNGNANRLVLYTDVTVNGLLTVNHSNTTAGHIDLNGFTIWINGDYTRSNSGDFRGHAGSSIFLGNGDAATVTGTLNFEAGYSILDSLVINAPLTTVTMGTADTTAYLVINAGELNVAGNNFTVTNTSVIDGTLSDNNNAGTNTFAGVLTINAGGTISTANNSPFIFGGSITNEGTVSLGGTGALTFSGGITNNNAFAQTAAGAISFAASQSLAGTNAISFTGAATIASGVTVTNSNSDGVTGVTFSGALIGADATATFVNQTLLTYLNIAAPMAIGTLDAGFAGNTVNYNLNNNQNIKGTTYHHLIFSNAGTKTLQGAVVVNGTFSTSGTTNTSCGTYNITFNDIVSYGSTGTFTAGADTVRYMRNGNQDIIAGTYGGVLISGGSGTKTFSGATTITGSLLVQGFSYVDVNGQTVTTAGNIYVDNGATLDIDANAQLLIANGRDLRNNGILRITGNAGNEAIVTINGAGAYTITQNNPAATIYAQHYSISNAAITISDGAIDNSDNFSNGSFSSSSAINAYLTLTGIDLTGFNNVSNVVFNNGATYNVSRTSGTGAITFVDASGALAGESYDEDNGNPGTLVMWTYPSSTYYSKFDGMCASNPANWSTTQDGTGPSPSSVSDGLATLIVQDGHTVTITSPCGDLNVNELIVGEGTSGVLIIGDDDGQRVLTIQSLLHVKAGASIIVGSSGSTSHLLQMYGNIINEGTINLRTTAANICNTEINAPNTIVYGPSNITFNMLTIKAGKTLTAADTLVVRSNFTIENGATFNDGDLSHYFYGNWIEVGTGQRTGSGTIIFNGINTIANAGGTPVNFYNVEFRGINGSIQENISVTNNFTVTNGAIVTINNYSVTVSGDFTVNTGTYNHTANTTIFNGTAAQNITLNGTVSFNNLTFSNGGALAKSVNGNITANGDVLISSGATVSGDGAHTLAGDLTVNGTCNFSGSITMTGTGNNVSTNNATNSLRLGAAQLIVIGQIWLGFGGAATADTVFVNNDVTIQSGYLVLPQNTWLINQSGSNTFTMNAAARLLVRGTNNFPFDFNNYDLDVLSITEYDAAMDQTVRGGITYGELELDAGGIKTAGGNIDVEGDLDLNAGITFDLQNYTHYFAGNILNGTNSTISGSMATVFIDGPDNNQTIETSGTGSYAFGNLTITQSAPTATRTKTFNNGSTVSLSGNLVISNPSGSVANRLIVDLNAITIGGTPVNMSMGAYTQLNTNLASFSSGVTDNFSGTITLDEESTVYYSLNGPQDIADGFTYGHVLLNGNTKTAEGPLDINGNIGVGGNIPLFVDGGFTHTVAGNWNLGTANCLQANLTGTIVLDGSDQEVGATNFNNLTVSNTGTAMLNGTMNVYGNISFSNGSRFDANNRAVNVGGNWVNSGTGIFTQNGGSLTFNGTANQTVASNTGSPFYNFTINKPNAAGLQTVTFITDVEIVNNTIITQDAGVLDISGQTVKFGNDLTVYANTVEAGANFISTNSNVIFNGAADQRIYNWHASPITFNNIEFTSSGEKQIGYRTDNGASQQVVVNGNWTINNTTVNANGGWTANVGAVDIFVAGNWINNGGNFTHQAARTVTFNGANQDISSSTFGSVVFAGTDTKTLQGNISVTGNLTISGGSTLDANDQNITLTGNWDNSAATAVFVPGTGTVIFQGNGISNVYTGTTTGPAAGKSFYEIRANKNTGNEVILQGDCDIANNFHVATGTFRTNTYEIWIGGDFRNDWVFQHTVGSVVTLNATGGTKSFYPGGATFRGLVFDAPGATYNVEGNFTNSGNTPMVINNGYVKMNGYTMYLVGNNTGITLNGGTLDVDPGATISGANNNHTISIAGGTFRMVGTPAQNAVITRTGGNGILIDMTSGTIHANNYKFDLGRGITISGGTIDATNNFSNGTFTGGSGTAYLTLTGLDFADFTADNVLFNSGPTYNVSRTSGNGTITFSDAYGTLAGEAYDNDNANPGTLILWTYPSGIYWDGGAGTDQWDDALNWTSNAVPTASDYVYLDHTFVAATYTVSVDSSDASCARLVMDTQGANPITLQLRMGRDLDVNGFINIGSGATLTVTDNTNQIYVGGPWTNSGTFNHGNSTVIFDAPAGTYTITSGGTGAGKIFYNLLFDGNDTATYNLAQAINIDGNITINHGTLDAVSGNYDLWVAGDWLVVNTTGGYFNPQTADITFDGVNQSINGGPFYNFITSGSGIKTIQSNIDIDGDVNIGVGTTLDAQEYSLYVGDDWYNNGSYLQTGFGSVTFDGAGAQEIDNGSVVTTFRHLNFSGAGTKTFYNNTAVTGDFTIISTSGTVNLQDKQISGTGTNTFTIAGANFLQVRGANNFPDNFANYNLNSTSTVEYISAIDQTIRASSGLSYGNLRLRDLSGGLTTKTAAGDLVVTGTLYIYDVNTLLDMATNDASLTLTGGISMPTGGVQIDWGIGTATLTHVGGNWYIDRDITGFHNLVLSGTGDKYMYGDLAITGNVTIKTDIDLMMHENNTALPHSMTGLAGKTFTMEGNARVFCPVAAAIGPAFPVNFGTYTISQNASLYLYSPNGVNQTIYTGNGISYGNVYFRNTKNVTSDGVATLDINGSFDMENATYIDNGRDINVAGPDIWLNRYTPSSSAVTFRLDGNINQYLRNTATNNIVFGNLTTSGTGTKTIGDGNDVITINGNFSNAATVTVTSACNITFSGSSWDNSGIFTHTANTVTFSSNAAQSINPGQANISNYFANVTFSGSGTKTFITHGVDVNADFTINAGTVDMDSLSHTIGDDILNTLGGTLISASADFTFDGAGQQDINTPAFAADSITIAGSSTKVMYSDWTINDDLVILTGATLNTRAAGNHAIAIKGDWNNSGTFTVNTSKVTFNGSSGPRSITSGGSNFYDVEFIPGATVTYSLQSPSTRIRRTMDVRANATLDLNGKTLILGSNIAAGKTYTIEGTLEADANATLLFNNQSSQSVVNVSGILRIVGSDVVNIATLSREVAGVAGAETQINILSGGTLEARYYLIEYLQDAGLQMQAGSILHATNNLSDGTWSNIRAATNVAYINLEANYAGDTINNICFNFSGTPTQGTHFNVRRNAAAGVIAFKNVTGNLGSYLYEDDEEVTPAAGSGKLRWPGITLTNWTGAKDQNWHDPLNWDNGVPTAFVDAVIPDRPNDPIIMNTNAECKNLTITTGTVVLDNDRKLTAYGDITIGTGTNTGMLIVGTPASDITCGGLWTRGTNGIFVHGNGTVIFNSSAGTTTIKPLASDFYNVVFDNPSTIFYLEGASINFKGSFTVLNGIVQPSTNNYAYVIEGNFVNSATFNPTGGAVAAGTCTFSGSDQNISRGNFYTLQIAGTGTKTVTDTLRVAGATTISSALAAAPGSYMDFNGDMTINAAASFDDGGNTHYFSGTAWRGNGAYKGSGTIVFDKTNGHQNIYASRFNNLDINCTGYRLLLRDSCAMYGNLTLRSGIAYAYLYGNIFYDTTGTSTFTMEDGVILYVMGYNNFPKNFGNYNIAATSYTRYYGTIDQLIAGGLNYGNLELQNATVKKLTGDIVIQGYLNINNSTLDVTANSYNISIGGYWYNNSTGTFIPHQGEVLFNGTTFQDIQTAATATTTFYDLRINSSNSVRTNSNITWVIQNNLYVENGIFDNNGRTVEIGGNMIASGGGLFTTGGTFRLNKSGGGSANIGVNGSTLQNLLIIGTGGVVYTLQDNLVLNGNFTLTSGTFNANGKSVTLGDGLLDVATITDTYIMGPGGTLLLGDGTALTVESSGRFEAVGTSAKPVTISRRGYGRYGFLVNGEIAARYYTFEYMNSTGIYLSNTSTIDATNNFSNGTFTNGANSGCYFRIENTQSFTDPNYITDVTFPNNPGGTASNVRKISAVSGTLEFYNATGSFAGENYDDDPLNLVIWTGPITLTWNGSVSTDWFNPANWTASAGPAIVPTGAENVIIAAAPNQPILDTTNAVTANLTINAGATLWLNTSAGDNAMDLDVKGNFTLEGGTLRMDSPNDSMMVRGSWINNGGTSLISGNVFFSNSSGTGVINNGVIPFYNLIILEPGYYRLAANTNVTNDVIINANSTLSLTGANYTLTVGGNFLNYGTFESFNGTVVLNAGGGTKSITNANSSFYDLVINGPGATYVLSDSLYIRHNLNLTNGTFDVNGKVLKVGDNAGLDYLSIGGVLEVDANAKVKMGAGSAIEVNSGGILKILGGDENLPAYITRQTTGNYGITVKDGGQLWAKYYDVSYTNANGIYMLSGSVLDPANNLSDGVFSNGYATGTYLKFENNFGSDDTLRNIIFNTGPVYNVTRLTGTGILYFADAAGAIGTYHYEKDIGGIVDPDLGLLHWKYLSTCVWTGAVNTDWHTPGNWACNLVPDTSNNIIIPDVVNDPVIDTAVARCKNLTMYSGAILTIKQNVTVNGDMFFSGTVTAVGSPQITIMDNWTNSGGTFNPATSKVLFAALSGTKNISPGTSSFYDLEINAAAATIFKPAANLTILHDLQILSGILNSNNYDITIAGSWINTGTFIPGTRTVTFNGTSGTHTISQGSSNFYNLTINSSTGTATYRAGSIIQVSYNYTLTKGSMDMSDDGGLTSYNLTIGNRYTNSGGTLLGHNATIQVGENWQTSGSGTFTAGTSTVRLTSNSGVRSVIPRSSPFYNLTIDGSATFRLGNSTTINNDLLINNGVFDVSTGTSYNITISGNWTNNATFNCQTGRVTFYGNVQQITKAGGETFYRLVVNTDSLLVSGGDMKVINSLVMTQGNIFMQGNTLVLGTSTANPGTLSRTTGTVIGKFERWVASLGTNYAFPVGTDTSFNNLIMYCNMGLTGGSVMVEFIASDPGSAGLPLNDGGPDIEKQFTDGYWNVIAKNSMACTNYNLTLIANGFNSYTLDANVRVLKRTNGGNWILDGNHSAASPPQVYRTNMNGISTISTQFALGVIQCVGGTIGTSDTVCWGTDLPPFTSIVDAQGATFTYTWQYTTDTNAVAGGPGWTDIPSSNSATYDHGVIKEFRRFVRKAEGCTNPVYSNIIRIDMPRRPKTGDQHYIPDDFNK